MHKRIWQGQQADLAFVTGREADQNRGDDPAELLRALMGAARRHGLKLALSAAFGVGLGLLYVRSLEPVYSAAATILLEPRRAAVTSTREPAPAPALDLNRADSELQVIRSEQLLAQVFRSLDLERHPELQPQPPGRLRAFVDDGARRMAEAAAAILQRTPLPVRQPAADPDQLRRIAFSGFAQRLTARRIGQSYVIEVSYRTSDKALASRAANAAASAYLLQSIAFKAEAARSGAEFVQGRVDLLSAQARAAAAAMAAGAIPEIATPDADARIIGAALPPLRPSGPPGSLIAALGGLVGLVGCAFALVVAAATDRRISDPQQMLRLAGVRCLAVVPRIGGRSRSLSELDATAVSDPDSGFAAALRSLRASIKLASGSEARIEDPVVALVGWRPGAGCSLICMNLARLTRWGGRATTVIDADVHGEGRGLTGPEWQTGSSLVDALRNGDGAPAVDRDGIAFIPARSAVSPANFFVDFSNPRLPALIETARTQGEVFIDLPPLSESADAGLLARLADATVIVVRHRKTTVDELRQTVETLRSGGALVIGAVINHA